MRRKSQVFRRRRTRRVVLAGKSQVTSKSLLLKKLTFSKTSRLRLHKAFELIFANGSKTATKDFVMWHTLDTKPETEKQIGVIASKKTGGAVRRNRLKRLLREAFRLSKDELKDGARVIIYFKAGCAIDSLKEAAAALDGILIKARLKK